MGWVKTITMVLVLWSSTAWGATLTWNASIGPGVTGYRVYNCSQSPCSQSDGTATVLATLGTVTSFNIGTPAIVQYYFVTAYNSANIESSPTNVVTYSPASTSSSTPASAPPPSVTLTVLGSPTTGQPWTVQAYPANVTGTVTVEFWINNALNRTELNAPYCPFDATDNGTQCLTAVRPFGTYTIEARVRSNGIEVARQAITVQASVTAPATSAPSVALTVLGSPPTGQPWNVQAYPANTMGTISVQFLINNTINRIESFVPYCPFDGADNGTQCVTAVRPFGFYTIEARVVSNGAELARRVIVVKASSQ